MPFKNSISVRFLATLQRWHIVFILCLKLQVSEQQSSLVPPAASPAAPQIRTGRPFLYSSPDQIFLIVTFPLLLEIIR